jgi:tRNA (guanine37-N1)-methyltransferase
MSFETAIGFLSKDILLNIDMLQAISQGEAHLLYADSEGVALYHKSAQAIMLSASNTQAAEAIVAGLGEVSPQYVAHQAFFLAPLKVKTTYQETMACLQAAYLGFKPLPEPSCPATIRPLDDRYLDFVMDNYEHAEDRQYIASRFEEHTMQGAFIKGEPVGFIGLHAEQSIGLLHVLPAYRRMGIGRALEIHMANHLIALGIIPFAQIMIGNEASLKLQKEIGFAVSDNPVWWLW